MLSRTTPRPRRPHLRVEALDPRDLPAGDIHAVFAGGVLTLTAVSTAAAEQVRVGMVTPFGGFSATGRVLVAAIGSGTTVNGQAAVVTPDGQPVRAVVVDLRGGDDRLQVTGLEVPGGLTVRLGDGADTAFVDGNTAVGGSLSVFGGAGDDTIGMFNGVAVGGALSVAAGAGDNDVDLGFGVRVGGALAVTAGEGADTLQLGDVLVGGATAVALGGGTNAVTGDQTDAGPTRLLGPARFAFGAGDDTFDLAKGTLFAAGLAAALGAGDNRADLEGFAVGRAVSVTGGAGRDFVLVADGEFAGSLAVALGDGLNVLVVDDLTDNPVGLVSTRGTTVRGGLTYTGGTGSDQIEVGDERPVRVLGATTIRTGDEPAGGVDIVEIDDASFYGPFLLATGGGGSIVAVDTTANTAGTTLLAGPATIRGGAGTDILRLGRADTAQAGVYFAVRPVLDGGAGAQDTLAADRYFFRGLNAPLGETGWEF